MPERFFSRALEVEDDVCGNSFSDEVRQKNQAPRSRANRETSAARQAIRKIVN
jgi:hypothetical protein